MLGSFGFGVANISKEDLRDYLQNYQSLVAGGKLA